MFSSGDTECKQLSRDLFRKHEAAGIWDGQTGSFLILSQLVIIPKQLFHGDK